MCIHYNVGFSVAAEENGNTQREGGSQVPSPVAVPEETRVPYTGLGETAQEADGEEEGREYGSTQPEALRCGGSYPGSGEEEKSSCQPALKGEMFGLLSFKDMRGCLFLSQTISLLSPLLPTLMGSNSPRAQAEQFFPPCSASQLF